jgi:hypothetical protein
LLLIASSASSQSVDVSALEVCAGLETPDLRLACFEAIAAGPAPAAHTSEPSLAAAEAPVSEQGVAPVDTIPEVMPAVTAAVTPEQTAASDFGQEYLAEPEKKEEQKNEILRATVTDVTKGQYNVLYFHLDNGQVWRQMEARHYQYPKNREFDINITRGMMGEYRMRIGDNGRMVRIRRVE